MNKDVATYNQDSAATTLRAALVGSEQSVRILRKALVKAEETLAQEKEDGEVAILEVHRAHSCKNYERKHYTRMIDEIRSGNRYPEAAGVGDAACALLDEALSITRLPLPKSAPRIL